jgi:hypothetical protein
VDIGYRLLTPIHQKARTYHKLVHTFDELAQLCTQITLGNDAQGRMWSKYYRVGFYGEAFEELDNKEFVYKESAACRLADISNRFTEQFGAKFGADKIQLLPNKPVERDTLDKGRLYIQIVEVTPYFSPDELSVRKTPFSRNFDLTRFMYETPFVKEGKKMGSMEDQYKRQTIVKTSHAFPSMHKRVSIVSKEEIILTPIETARDLIRGRSEALQKELSSGSPNTKTLQIVLQGSVLLQVNAGPLEICRLFLSEDKRKELPEQHVQELDAAMKEFFKLCGFALALNGSLITDDQLPFQEKLKEGYRDLRTQMSQYVDLKPPRQLDASREASAV